jgi:homotetrameric cytidine deaminase
MSWTNLKQRSYTPYANKTEACVVQSHNGTFHPGVRIENASFPLTITQYQAALFGCISEGEVPKTIFVESEQVAVPKVWTDTYKLDVVQNGDFPVQHFDTRIVSKPNDIPAFLKQLQHNCKIEESNFPVSCLLQVGEDAFITGVNVELFDWQLGLCAERIALAKAISMGFSKFQSIHITAAKGDFISPCGACRQVLVEHLPYEKTYLYHPDGTQSEHTPAEFLPAFFNGKSIRT